MAPSGDWNLWHVTLPLGIPTNKYVLVLCSIMLKAEYKTVLRGSSFWSRMWLGLTATKSRGRLQSQSVIFIKALPLRSLSPRNPWETETTFMTMVWRSPISDRLFFFLSNNAVTLNNLERLFHDDVVVASSYLLCFYTIVPFFSCTHGKFILEDIWKISVVCAELAIKINIIL